MANYTRKPVLGPAGGFPPFTPPDTSLPATGVGPGPSAAPWTPPQAASLAPAAPSPDGITKIKSVYDQATKGVFNNHPWMPNPGDWLGNAGEALDANPIAQGIASATNTGMKALGDLSGLGNTVLPYLPQTGFDIGKSKALALQNSGKQQQAIEAQTLNNPPGALFNAALTYPGTRALDVFPAVPAIEALGRRILSEEIGAVGNVGKPKPPQFAIGQEVKFGKSSGKVVDISDPSLITVETSTGKRAQVGRGSVQPVGTETAPTKYQNLSETVRAGEGEGSPVYGDYAIHGGSNYREFVITLDNVASETSGHWPTHPGTVVHARVGDFVDKSGKKVLMLHETQSEWAQALRKGETMTESGTDLSIAGPHPLPKTGQWLDLALRSVLKHAADEGYDKVAWVPGSKQWRVQGLVGEDYMTRAEFIKMGPGMAKGLDEFYDKIVLYALKDLGKKYGGVTPGFSMIKTDRKYSERFPSIDVNPKMSNIEKVKPAGGTPGAPAGVTPPQGPPPPPTSVTPPAPESSGGPPSFSMPDEIAAARKLVQERKESPAAAARRSEQIVNLIGVDRKVLETVDATPEKLAKTLGLLKGQHPKDFNPIVPLGEKLSEADQMDYFKKILDAFDDETLRPYDYLHAKQALTKMVEGDWVRLQESELDALEKVFPGVKVTLEEAAKLGVFKSVELPNTGQGKPLPAFGKEPRPLLMEEPPSSLNQTIEMPGMGSYEGKPRSMFVDQPPSHLDATIPAPEGQGAMSAPKFSFKDKLEFLEQKLVDLTKATAGESRSTVAAKAQQAQEIKKQIVKLKKDMGVVKTPVSTPLSSTPVETPPLTSMLDEAAYVHPVVKSTRQSIVDAIVSILNIPKSIKSSIDLSGGRQAQMIMQGHPEEGLAAIGKGAHSFASQAAADAVTNLIIKSKYGAKSTYGGVESILDRSGLFLSNFSKGLGQMEENFASSIANKIPGVKQSARAFSTMLNYLRITRFEAMAGEMEKRLGVATGQAPIKQYQDIADAINKMTGRGNLGYKTIDVVRDGKVVGTRQVEVGHDLLTAANTIFFSPRLNLSRLQIPFLIFSKSPEVRKEVMRNLAAFNSQNLILLTALSKAGLADVELDSRSSDFGKIKVGNQRLDPWGGYQQYMVAASRLATGQTKTQSGNVISVQRGEVAGNFGRTKLSPTLGKGIDILSGQNMVGESTNPTAMGKAAMKAMGIDPNTLPPVGVAGLGVGAEAWDLISPMMLMDYVEAVRLEGPRGAILAVPGFVGVGEATYEPSPNTALTLKANQIAKQEGYTTTYDQLPIQEQKKLFDKYPEIQQLQSESKVDRAEQGPKTYQGNKEATDAASHVMDMLPSKLRSQMTSSGVMVGEVSRSLQTKLGFTQNMGDAEYQKFQDSLVNNLAEYMPRLTNKPGWDQLPSSQRNQMMTKMLDLVKEKTKADMLSGKPQGAQAQAPATFADAVRQAVERQTAR